MKINFGSGETKLEGFINIDLESSSKPDLVCDLRKDDLPFEASSVELVQFFHCLEHIERKYWNHVFNEFWRVLQPNAMLFLAYPEFEKCAKYFLENYRGLRDLFRNTLYGRQLYPGDYHVVPMRTVEVVDILYQSGFHEVKYEEDPNEDWSTILYCYKGALPLLRSDIFKKEIFPNINAVKTRFELVPDVKDDRYWESRT